MSNKIKKIIFTAASALAVVGMGVSVYAISAGIEATVKKKVFAGSYEYGQPGHTLRIEANYNEYNDQTLDSISDTVVGTAFGNSTGVTCSKNARTDYNFTVVHFFAKVDGQLQAMSVNMFPED